MPDGNGALHPLAAIAADVLGIKVRWSMQSGVPGRTGTVVLCEGGEGVPPLVLACNDADGDSTVLPLTPGQVVELRDALTDWITGR